MEWATILPAMWVGLEFILKVIALGTVPENRRPSSSSAWLLLIMFVPVIGFPLYWVLGSPVVRGRRHRIQVAANEQIAKRTADLPMTPDGIKLGTNEESVLVMNRKQTSLPCVTGRDQALFSDTAEFFGALAEAINDATDYANIEFYIVSRDEQTEPVFQAMFDAVKRGVKVRLLLDQIGSQKYPGRKEMYKALTDAGVDWHEMMPIAPLRGKWRRPDLRNHRKLVIIDGKVGFVGSHNLIGVNYGSAKNAKIGRAWKDLSMRVTGDIVLSISAVFVTDWYTETGELLTGKDYFLTLPEDAVGGDANAMQIVPSGPGFPTEPNHRMFCQLINLAVKKVTITSPYFVPDEALISAIVTACYRGVEVDLFVGEKADQFLIGHAQSSYYQVLLEAGVKIYRYPAPKVLHAKYLTVDGVVGACGSSNMDFRSFGLNYEIMLLGFGGDMVDNLQKNDAEYRSVCKILTIDEWKNRSWGQRYLDNVCRLTAALM